MCRLHRTIMMPALVAALLLAGCGQVPGVDVDSPGAASDAPSAAGGLTAADVEATVQARLAEVQASAAAASAVPSAAGGLTEADVEATVQARLAELEASAQAAASAAPSPSAVASVAASPSVAASIAASPSASASVAASAAASTAAAASQAPVATGEGELIVAGRSNILSQFKDGAWSTYTLDGNSCLNYNNEALYDTDGTPVISCSSTVLKATGPGQWEPFDDEHRGNVYLAPDGRLWVVQGLKMWMRDGEEWTTFEAEETIRAQSFPNDDVAFTPDGKVYFGGVSGEAQLVLFDGTEWRNYGEITDSGHIRSLLYTSKGELLVGTNSALFRLNGDALEPVLTTDQLGALFDSTVGYSREIREIVETPDGTIWLATDGGVVSWNGSEAKLEGVAAGLPAFTINDLQVDEGGNLWAATVHGIAVRRDGAWQATVPATSGLGDGFVWTIATRGTPQLPPADAEPKTASITGRVTIKNVPLANKQVELCSEEPGRYKVENQGETPCANQFFHQVAPTDGDGVYRFENVPTGNYSLALQNEEGQWVNLLFGNADIDALTPGQKYSLDVPLN